MSDDTGNNDEEKSYEVGYKKPPESGKFKKGKPNPGGGRKKGQKNFRTDFMEELQTKVEVNEGGKKVKISKQRGLIKRMINGSLNGDPKATALTVSLMLDFSNSDELKSNAKPLSSAEEELLKNYLKKQGDENAE